LAGEYIRIQLLHQADNPSSTLTSAIITICVGPEQRLFAGHEEILCQSPFFEAACRGQFVESNAKRINLPEEIPEVLSSVLEYLYKGDYSPKLMHNKRKDTWELEDIGGRSSESTIYHNSLRQTLLKDTVI
jgi:BTB/POZ domain